MKEKRMTLDVLARMVQNGFKDVDVRFNAVDARFESLEKKVDDGFEKVDIRLTKIENGHIGRIERLEDDMRVVKTKIGIR
jgi:hypothetical protein